METKDFKETKGITLISLVVMILILLILAGVTIATLIGDNGIINQTKKASKETAKSDFKERANMILAEMHADELTGELIISGDNETAKNASRLAVLASKMKNEIEFRAPVGVEYQISSMTIGNGSESSPLIVPSDSSKGTKAITVTISPKEGANYYAKIQGICYPITLDTALTLGTAETVSTGNNEIPEVQANSQNSKVNVSAVQDTTNRAITTITLSGKSRNLNVGETDTINVFLPGKESSENIKEKQTVPVKVGAIYTVRVESELEENSTTSRKGTITSPSLKSGEVYAEEDYLEGSMITLSAIPKENSNYQLKGWFIGETELSEIDGTENQYRLPTYNNGLTIDSNNKININITAKFDKPATLASVANVGDYVDINVGYTDQLVKDSNDNNIVYTKTGWRVLYNANNKLALISTGHPLTFDCERDKQESLAEMNTLKSGEIAVSSNASPGYRKNGFDTNNLYDFLRIGESEIFDSIKISCCNNSDSSVNVYDVSEILVSGGEYWLASRNGSENMWYVTGSGDAWHNGYSGEKRYKTSYIVKNWISSFRR